MLTLQTLSKMHIHISDAIYLLALLTNVIVEANNVDPDQQQYILCLNAFTQRLFKHFSSLKKDDFVVISN